ncbi:hypothetical protein [Roseivirga sp.]|uniref:hypothetical protein n=1 Tax=Roseivirga sp. TaxID=1964215 RepID=UPI003B8C6C77
MSITIFSCSDDIQPEVGLDNAEKSEISIENRQMEVAGISFEQSITVNKMHKNIELLGIEVNGIALEQIGENKWRAKVSETKIDENRVQKNLQLPKEATVFGQVMELPSFAGPECNIEVESYGRWDFDDEHDICYTYFGTTCFETVMEDGIMTTYVTYSRQLVTSLCDHNQP